MLRQQCQAMHSQYYKYDYRNKNLAVANRSRVSCAHNTSEGISSNPMTLKSRLRFIQGHLKRNHWIDYKRPTIKSSYLTLNNSVTLKSGLQVTQGHWNWCHSKLWVRFPFAFYSNYGRICSRLWDIQRQKNGVTLKTGLGFVQGHWKWHH